MSVGFLLAMAFLTVCTVAVDQGLKLLVVRTLAPVGSIPCIPKLLNWTYVENRGAAFGMLQNQKLLFSVLTVAMVVFCVYYLLRHCTSKWMAVSLTLIVGGGIGNLIDRLWRGFVVDFISVSFFPPVFNFADICVVVGGGMLLLLLVREILQEERKKGELPSDDAK